ncbi:MAG TPA: YHS domain-containing protein [Methanocella sp.]|jgi:YHS domain-containing protein
MVKCLVCDKEVIQDTHGAKELHKGETYYFCSNKCKTEFNKYPETHLAESARPPKQHRHP